MEGKIRKRIGETFENQLKARNKHLMEINNPDIKSVRKESKLNKELTIEIDDTKVDPVLRYLKRLENEERYRRTIFPSNDITCTYSYPNLLVHVPQTNKIHIVVGDKRISDYLRRRNQVMAPQPKMICMESE